MKIKSSNKYHSLLLTLSLGLVFVLLFSIFVGRFQVSFSDFLDVIFKKADETIENVVLKIRIPRAITALLSGGALGISGSIFQKAFRNPLASPDIIGISSGASLGGALSIVFISTTLAMTQFMAFLFGILSLFLVILISKANKSNKIFSLIVSGVVINALTSSFLMFVKYTADPYQKLPAIEYFLMGGLYNVRIHQVYYLALVLTLCLILLYRFRWRFTVLSLDDDEIIALGVNPSRTRFFMLGIASLLVSTTVSICGVISFIALISPYLARLLTKNLPNGNMRISFLIGAIILSIADMISRTITASEIPVGIIISLISTPILIFMLSRNEKNYDV